MIKLSDQGWEIHSFQAFSVGLYPPGNKGKDYIFSIKKLDSPSPLTQYLCCDSIRTFFVGGGTMPHKCSAECSFRKDRETGIRYFCSLFGGAVQAGEARCIEEIEEVSNSVLLEEL